MRALIGEPAESTADWGGWSWGSWHGEEDAAREPGYVLDAFTDLSFSGNDGVHDWAGAWAEIGESNGPANGRIRVGEYSKCADGNCMRINTRTEDRGVVRAVDLDGVASATLSFDYYRRNLEVSNLHLEISADGGATWVRLHTFNAGNDDAVARLERDISAHAGRDTRIRFIVDGAGGGNNVYLDNVKITY